MSQRGRKRFTLADLVFLAVLCGLVMAMVVAPSGASDPRIVAFLIAVVFVGWIVFRCWPERSNCQECGLRFMPLKHSWLPFDCLACGARQRIPARKHRLLTIAIWALVPVIPVLLVAALFFGLPGLTGARLSIRQVVRMAMAASGAVAAILAMGRLDKLRGRLLDAEGRICEACGAGFKRPPVDRICPACLIRGQGRAGAKRVTAGIPGTTMFGPACVAILLGAVLVILGRWTLGRGGWEGIVFVVMGGLGYGHLVARMVVSTIRTKRLHEILHEESAIARARWCAGEQGVIVRDGPTTIWYTGPVDPSAGLRGAFAGARRCFESVLGMTASDTTPLLILAFHDQNSLKAFQRWVLPSFSRSSPLPGLYLQPPWNILAVCIGEVRGRLDHRSILVRSFPDSVLVDQVFAARQAEWLRCGLNRVLGALDGQDDARLNRRLIVALATDLAWNEELFTVSASRLIRLSELSDNPLCILKLELFIEQSGSILDYLLGEHAPEPRRAAFRAFLQDRSRDPQEVAFLRHFGFGFGTLLEAWREWVNGHGIGPDLPPSPWVWDSYMNRLLPMIRDRGAPRDVRIRSIREWAKLGYILGADSLIELLRAPGVIPRAEIVWALTMASGQLLGDDPDRWRSWWDALPAADGIRT